MLFGPDETGNCVETRASSIHRYRSPCRVLKAGQAATLALKGVDRGLVRKVRLSQLATQEL